MTQRCNQVCPSCYRLAVVIVTALTLGAGIATADTSATDLRFQSPKSSWALGMRSTGYAFQTEDAAGNTEDHFRFFQHYNGSVSGLAGGAITFRAAGRFANSAVVDYPGFENSRLYTGYMEARLGAHIRARMGRMFLQSGVAGLTLDGAWMSWRRNRNLEVSLWGGGRAPIGHGYEWSDYGQDQAYGARLFFSPARKHRLVLSGAYRERYGEVSESPLGVEYVTTAVQNLRALARLIYDSETDRWSRLEAQGQWRARRGQPVVTFQFVDRHPSVDAQSWFARFTDLERISLLRSAVSWRNVNEYGGEVEYVGSFVGSRSSSRVGLAALLPLGRIGYSLRVGDQGDENSVYGDFGWDTTSWLRLEAEASYLTYALFSDAPTESERDLTTLAGRLCARLRPGLNLTAEVQSMKNPLYDSDVRFLLGIDMAMARGTSRLGLDRGGWLR